MSIAFDAASGSATAAGATLTISHTCSGVGRVLFVSCSVAASGTISGVTYNGVAMTQIATQGVGTVASYLFYLVAPSTGANNIVITKSGGTTIFGCGSSYTGALQSGIPDSFNSNSSSTSTSVSQSTTTILDNCWVVCGGLCGNGGLSGGTNVTIRDSNTSDQYIGDTNAVKSPAGSITQTVNCTSGNNTIIMASFAPSITRYWVGGTGTWDTSDTTHWSDSSGGTAGSSAPTTTDSVIFDSSSGGGTVTVGATISIKSLTCTGYTGTITQSSQLTVSGSVVMGNAMTYTVSAAFIVTGSLTMGTTTVFAGSSALTLGGSLTLTSGMTLSYTGTITFNATVGGNTITSAGKSFGSVIIFNGVGGAWIFGDDFITTGASITLTNGTLVLGSQNVTAPIFSSSNSNTRVLTMGSGTVTLNGTGTVWDIGTSTGMTLTANTSTVKITNASSSTKTFSGGSKTYYNLWITGSGTGAYTIVGSNTFNDFKVDTPPHTVNFTAGTNQTVSSFTVNGTSGNLMTLQSTSAGTQWLLTSANTVSIDYISLQDSRGIKL